MDFLENTLRSWFYRNLPERMQNSCRDLNFILSSDIGLIRNENQDRVAAMYTGLNSKNPLFVAAVSDGMGGMRDGGICSSMALSVFFSSLVRFTEGSIEERVRQSICEANRVVFDNYRGGGGATLTAILVNLYGNRVLAHVGDTRIYSFDSNSVERHTADDSLMEAVGGSGRGLLQFVGMGEGVIPKIDSLPKDRVNYAITTDGIHGMEEGVFHKVLCNSVGIKQAADRLGALSRWLGGQDNSSSAFLNLEEIEKGLPNYNCKHIQIWDACGELTVPILGGGWMEQERSQNKSEGLGFSRGGGEVGEVKKRGKLYVRKAQPKKSIRVRDKGGNYSASSPERVQLDIKIISSDSKGE